MKYKVGDKVRIRGKEWYDKHKDANGEIRGAFFDKDRAKLCGTIQTIANGGFIDGLGVTIYAVEDAYEFIGEEAIEGLVETKFGTALNPLEPKSNANCLTRERVDEMSLDKAGQITDFEYEGLAYTLPNGYQFVDENGNVINSQKIVLEKKKKDVNLTQEQINKMIHDSCVLFCKHCGCGIPRDTCTSLGTCKEHDEYRAAIKTHLMEKKKKEYPKTYEECCKVLGYDDREVYCIFHTGADETLFEALYRLKVCRDAYWKIAGEEMGLGKPWELSIGIPIYYIYYNRTLGTIKKDYADDIQGNVILAFSTEEMRDAFYENFKEEIEICKELL